MNRFQVRCERCDKPHTVSAKQAGGSIHCSCGSDVAVPSLSQLRRTAGLGAYEKSVSERLLQLVFDDQLPTHHGCICCGDPRADRQNLVAVCERSYRKSEGGGAVAGSIGGIPFFFPLPGDATGEEVGRNVTVPLVFDICSSCWRSSRRGGLWSITSIYVAIGATALSATSFAMWVMLPLAGYEAVPIWWTWVGICIALLSLASYVVSFSTSPLRALKKRLCKEPIYRELFKEYPDAELFELESYAGDE